MIDSVLGNRYRILEQIGEGGMALVFKAEDTLLQRVVAVKILRPQYASDACFVERFRREALSAARLSHPNIVTVYDVGQAGETYYIVMELVEGRNLKSLIAERAPLPVAVACGIALEIAAALRHAHEHGIVHRDIKPHNILITPEGRVKVTDFGIARAMAESALTQTGMVIGSVHYTSPEQARGGRVGPQSDLYSLGVVLYEMLTGRVPYEGETAISVALKHLEEGVPSVRAVNKAVPVEVERIVCRAMAKELKDRYASAQEMIADLQRVTAAFDQRTQLLPVLPPAGRAPRPGEKEALGAEGTRRRPTPLWVLAGFFTLVGLGFLLWFLQFFPAFMSVAEVRVPNVVGKSLAEAQAILAARQLRGEVAARVYDSTVPVDFIVSQDPPPNRLVKVNRTVRLTVSRGPELVIVPDLTGLTLREAELALNEVGLTLGQQEAFPDAGLPAGRIVRQNPPPLSRLEKGLAVDVTVSTGTEEGTISVPDVTGRPFSEAANSLKGAGLVVGQVVEEARPGLSAAPNVVLSQNPPPGTLVLPGSSVDLVVSQKKDSSSGESPGFSSS
ncbi:MAG: Stk1 family PASTA domain-containing Ser/Thr kinase, partial [Bacillota bacterium]|nr:Stk1 family PASTA domain-containing Ser/Thr kinase [Bacillota bacterium]